MNILAWFNPARWLMLAGLVLSMAAGYYAWRSHERGIGAAPYIAAIAAQKTEATAKLAIETDRVNAVNKQLEFALATQEKTDGINQQKIVGLDDRLRALAAAGGGRLRDPAGCGGGGGAATSQAAAGAPDRAADPAEAGGLLSAELTGLLFSQAEAADQINLAYASCRADSQALRALLKTH